MIEAKLSLAVDAMSSLTSTANDLTQKIWFTKSLKVEKEVQINVWTTENLTAASNKCSSLSAVLYNMKTPNSVSVHGQRIREVE